MTAVTDPSLSQAAEELRVCGRGTSDLNLLRRTLLAFTVPPEPHFLMWVCKVGSSSSCTVHKPGGEREQGETV